MSASAAGDDFTALIEAVRTGNPEALASLYREVSLDVADQKPWPLADANVIALQGAVNSLPDSLRVVIMLKGVEGYSHGEVAELLGISVAASRVRAARGLARLRKALEDGR